jgi:sugar-specific transcriptional regulator TrmB
MKIELLENLGLTKSEIKVYLSLLELNSASVSEIAEKSGMYRKNVYDALNRLLKKGLVSFAKIETKLVFNANDPERLLDFVEIRKKEIQSILPQLKKIYKAPPIADDVRIFKGKEGLKTIFQDIIKAKTEYDKFGSGEKFKEFLPFYYGQYQKEKAKNKIKCRAIYSENERNEGFVKDFIGDVRFLSKEFVDPSTTFIYTDKIAIIIWKENPIGILIHSKEVAESYRYYFESLWNNAKK